MSATDPERPQLAHTPDCSDVADRFMLVDAHELQAVLYSVEAALADEDQDRQYIAECVVGVLRELLDGQQPTAFRAFMGYV